MKSGYVFVIVIERNCGCLTKNVQHEEGCNGKLTTRSVDLIGVAFQHSLLVQSFNFLFSVCQVNKDEFGSAPVNVSSTFPILCLDVRHVVNQKSMAQIE